MPNPDTAGGPLQQENPPVIAAWFRDSAEKAPRLIQGKALGQGLLERLAEAPPPRDGHDRYPRWRAVLGNIVPAKLAGTHLGRRPIAKFARRLTRKCQGAPTRAKRMESAGLPALSDGLRRAKAGASSRTPYASRQPPPAPFSWFVERQLRGA